MYIFSGRVVVVAFAVCVLRGVCRELDARELLAPRESYIFVLNTPHRAQEKESVSPVCLCVSSSRRSFRVFLRDLLGGCCKGIGVKSRVCT